MSKIILTDKHGATEVIELAEEVRLISVSVAEGMEVAIDVPTYLRTANVRTTVTTNKLKASYDLPTVSLCVGETDDHGFTRRTEAMMYATDSDRIIGKNQTSGYASTEKPLATKPWKRRSEE